MRVDDSPPTYLPKAANSKRQSQEFNQIGCFPLDSNDRNSIKVSSQDVDYFSIGLVHGLRASHNTDSIRFTVSPQNAIFPHAASAYGANINGAVNSDGTGKSIPAPWTDIFALIFDFHPRIHYSDYGCCADDFPERFGNL